MTDFLGLTFGDFEVNRRAGTDKWGSKLWHMVCPTCKSEEYRSSRVLKRGKPVICQLCDAARAHTEFEGVTLATRREREVQTLTGRRPASSDVLGQLQSLQFVPVTINWMGWKRLESFKVEHPTPLLSIVVIPEWLNSTVPQGSIVEVLLHLNRTGRPVRLTQELVRFEAPGLELAVLSGPVQSVTTPPACIETPEITLKVEMGDAVRVQWSAKAEAWQGLAVSGDYRLYVSLRRGYAPVFAFFIARKMARTQMWPEHLPLVEALCRFMPADLASRPTGEAHTSSKLRYIGDGGVPVDRPVRLGTKLREKVYYLSRKVLRDIVDTASIEIVRPEVTAPVIPVAVVVPESLKSQQEQDMQRMLARLGMSDTVPKPQPPKVEVLAPQSEVKTRIPTVAESMAAMPERMRIRAEEEAARVEAKRLADEEKERKRIVWKRPDVWTKAMAREMIAAIRRGDYTEEFGDAYRIGMYESTGFTDFPGEYS